MAKELLSKFKPLSAKYCKNWIKKNFLRENELHNLESLIEIIDLKPGMKVLDIGSEKAVSAIYLAKEFDVKVWTINSKISASSNFKRIKEMGCEDSVFPMRVNERQLPFPVEYFDLILSVDSYMNFRTDFSYSNYISKFLKPGGQMGIVDLCSNYSKNVEKENSNENKFNFVQSLDWWYNLWENTDSVNVKILEIVPENELMKELFIINNKTTKRNELLASEFANDEFSSLNIFRMVAQKINREINYKFYGF